jgi:toxin YoeB
MKISFTEESILEYLAWQQIDIRFVEKINALIKSMLRDGLLSGEGKPEKLKYSDMYSRRIDQKNRLIYQLANENEILIVSCKGHYSDR